MTRRINQDLSEGQSGLVSEKILADLRGLLWRFPGKDGDFAEIADRAGVSKATVQRLLFMEGSRPQTRRPHLETVVRLAIALGRDDLVMRIFSGTHEPVPYGKSKSPLKKRSGKK